MLTLKTAPAKDALSDAEVISHLRVGPDCLDAEADLRGKVKAAISDVENATSRQLVTATWQLVLCEFPPDDRIILPRPPLLTVDSITYYDSSNALQTLGVSLYTVLAPAGERALPGAIVLASGQGWPATYVRPDAVTIEFKAGYGAEPATVPAFLRAMALLRLGELYEQRNPVAAPIDLASALAGWRVLA